jgi:hypothetical protein
LLGDVSESNLDISGDFYVDFAFTLAGVLFRGTGVDDRWSAVISLPNIELYNRTGGVSVLAASYNASLAAGTHTIRVVCIGETLQIYVNGVLCITYASAVRKTATLIGVRLGNINETADNFYVYSRNQEESRFWGGTTVGDATLAPYTDDQFTDVFRLLFTKDPITQGIVPGYLSALAVSGAVSPVSAATGAAIVDGKVYVNQDAKAVIIPTPAVSARYDRIVLRKDFVAQTVRITRIAGVEGAGVPAITQIDGVTWDIKLTQVYITTLGAITLTDERSNAISRLTSFRDYRHICEGRLTLTSGMPITTSDVLAAATLYFAPYLGNRIGLYYAGGWDLYDFTEKSVSMAAWTIDKNYDIFGYYDGSALALEGLVWTDDTNRATPIVLQDGFYVKQGDPTRRYLGTIRMSAAGQCEDSTSKRYVWNLHHRKLRALRCFETTDNWAYNVAAWREINGGSTLGTSRFGFVIGLVEDLVAAQALHTVDILGASRIATGIGVDVSNANSAVIFGASQVGNSRSSPLHALYRGYPGLGFHTLRMLEFGNVVTAIPTFHGDDGTTLEQSGMRGEVWA